MRSLWPCSNSSTTSSFPSQLEGKFGLPGPTQEPGLGRSLGREWLPTPVFLPGESQGRVTTWISGFLLCWPWKPKLPFELRGKAGCCARTTARPKRPHLGVCPGPNSPLKGRQGSRDCTPDSPGEPPSSRAEGLLFLHGLESNPGSSLQTEEEAGLP